MNKWTKKELKVVGNKTGSKLVSGLSVRKQAEYIQSKFLKNRSVESIRHKIRELYC